jgi:hypothetical protein
MGWLSIRQHHASPKPTSGESEGRTATKAFRKREFSLASNDQAQAQQPGRDVPSVGMFRVPQSVNCSVRRLFGYSLLFCAFLRTK